MGDLAVRTTAGVADLLNVRDNYAAHIRDFTRYPEAHGLDLGYDGVKQYVSDEIAKEGHRILKRKISAYVMRHSFATLSIRDGASVKAVSSYLGHSSTAITQDMYVHETLGRKQMIRRHYKRTA